MDILVNQMKIPDETAKNMIDVCYRLGKPRLANQNLFQSTNRRVLVKLMRKKHRSIIYQHVKNLHRTNLRIEPDMTKLAQEKNNLLLKHRRDVKDTATTVKMTNAGLVVDGVLHVVDKSMNVVVKN